MRKMANKKIIKQAKKRKSMNIKYRIRRKIGVAFLLVGGIFLVLGGRIFSINYESGDKYSKIVLDHQNFTSMTIPYKRGQIVDRNGTQLAYSEKVYNLILDPKMLLSEDKYKQPTLSALYQYFSINSTDIETILKNKPNSQYEKIIKNLTANEIKEFREFLADTTRSTNVKGIWFEDSYIRKYPLNTVACDVVGFSGNDGGELGLEKQYDEELSGIDGVTYGYVDEGLNVETTTKEPVDGNNLITTLDFGLQSIIEKHIKEFNLQYGSKNTAVLVMSPDNGEILGMASYPVFNLNTPRDLKDYYSEEELAMMSDEDKTTAMYALWKNFCVSTIYEPGSTYKPFTVSSALEENFAHDGDTYYCGGYENIGGWTIKCHEKAGHGMLNLEQTIMYSCNPAMMQISAKMGAITFGEYQKRFGLGAKTGIDLPGEENGIIIDGDKMGDADLATMSFGQNFNVNMVQMASAFCSLVNGGNYYKPHIVKRIETSSGEIVKNNTAELVRQTVTSSTSEFMKQYLKETVDTGLAKNAKVAGYSIGGKTGTAQKLPRSENKYVISFLGCSPAEDPKFVIYVVIDEPLVEGYNGSSQPVLWLTKSILTDLLPYMNVFKDTDLANTEDTQTNSAVEKYDEPAIPTDMGNAAAPNNSTTATTTAATTAATSTTKAATTTNATKAATTTTKAATASTTKSTAAAATKAATTATTKAATN